LCSFVCAGNKSPEPHDCVCGETMCNKGQYCDPATGSCTEPLPLCAGLSSPEKYPCSCGEAVCKSGQICDSSSSSCSDPLQDCSQGTNSTKCMCGKEPCDAQQYCDPTTGTGTCFSACPHKSHKSMTDVNPEKCLCDTSLCDANEFCSTGNVDGPCYPHCTGEKNAESCVCGGQWCSKGMWCVDGQYCADYPECPRDTLMDSQSPQCSCSGQPCIGNGNDDTYACTNLNGGAATCVTNPPTCPEEPAIILSNAKACACGTEICPPSHSDFAPSSCSSTGSSPGCQYRRSCVLDTQTDEYCSCSSPDNTSGEMCNVGQYCWSTRYTCRD
jgi:hypothetical protein